METEGRLRLADVFVSITHPRKRNETQSADPTALFLVWGGPNDYFDAGLTPPESALHVGGVI